MNRRESLKLLATTSLASGFSWSLSDVQYAQDQIKARQGKSGSEPSFFTDHEYKTVRVLVDLIIPADDRSGSATDAGVPAFMNFMMTDQPGMQMPMRGGLAWLDYQSRKRFGTPFVEATAADRYALLDEIAYPEIAHPDMRPGVAWFNSFRDLTASGFWSSKMGVEDLQYIGNTFVSEWNGCPAEVLDRLGVTYDE